MRKVIIIHVLNCGEWSFSYVHIIRRKWKLSSNCKILRKVKNNIVQGLKKTTKINFLQKIDPYYLVILKSHTTVPLRMNTVHYWVQWVFRLKSNTQMFFLIKLLNRYLHFEFFISKSPKAAIFFLLEIYLEKVHRKISILMNDCFLIILLYIHISWK